MLEGTKRWLAKQLLKQTLTQRGMFNNLMIGYGTPSFIGDNLYDYIAEGYTNDIVYSVVKKIVQPAAQIPWTVNRIVDEKALKNYKNAPKKYQQKLYRKALEPIDSHELYGVIDSPNGFQSKFEFFEQLLAYKMVTGNSYMLKVGPDGGPNAGKPKELYNLPSQFIEIIANNAPPFGEVTSYELNVANTIMGNFPPEDILHRRNVNLEFDLDGRHHYGMSPLSTLRKSIRVSNDARTAAAALLQNTGAKGILSYDGAPDDMEFSEEQSDAMKEQYKREYVGPKKYGLPVITSAKMKWQPMAMSPADLAIIELQQATLVDIARVYNVDPSILGDKEKSTFNNVETARKALWTDTIIPELTSLRDDLNEFLGKPYGVYLDYDLSDVYVLQNDMKEQAEILKSAYWLTENEKREQLGYEPQPWGDVANVPANLIPIDQNDPE